MQSFLAWIDHDSKAREQTLEIISKFQAKESRDELGLGAIRDSFADRLFPGTSTIQTRLRYMFFIPWTYKKLEEERVPAKEIAQRDRDEEIALIDSLASSKDTSGIIGIEARAMLKRLPSSIYWAGLGKWGIRVIPYSQEEYHRHIDQIYMIRDRLKKAKEEDSQIFDLARSGQTWHPRLPDPPKDYPKKASFKLTYEESEFIQDCLLKKCEDSFLSYLANNPQDINANYPWELPGYGRFNELHKELLRHAWLFSETMYGAVLSYNYQLSTLRGETEWSEDYKKEFEKWADNIPLDEINKWDLNRLWELTVGHGHTITGNTKLFVVSWVKLVRKNHEGLLEDKKAIELVKKREEKVKRHRSRFNNKKALEQWSGASGTYRLDYRWGRVKVLLKDLYMGLE